jgi:hypothetical protein
LWKTLFSEDKPREKIWYEAHGGRKESLFSVGFKAFWNIWWQGNYEFSEFTGQEVTHNFVSTTQQQEIYRYILQNFQYEIDTKDFSDTFWIDFEIQFKEEIDFFLYNSIIIKKWEKYLFNGNKNLIWYYGLLFLDETNLLRLLHNRKLIKK